MDELIFLLYFIQAILYTDWNYIDILVEDVIDRSIQV
jgi:hypothetical protein